MRLFLLFVSIFLVLGLTTGLTPLDMLKPGEKVQLIELRGISADSAKNISEMNELRPPHQFNMSGGKLQSEPVKAIQGVETPNTYLQTWVDIFIPRPKSIQAD